jgi:diguanylate cyclase (GGDEF)-like protein
LRRAGAAPGSLDPGKASIQAIPGWALELVFVLADTFFVKRIGGVRADHWFERARAAWTLDLTDEVRLRAVRAHILLLGSVLGLISTIGPLFAGPAQVTRPGPQVTAGLIIGLIAVGTCAAGFGRRMKDGLFLVLLIVVLIIAAVTIWSGPAEHASAVAHVALGMTPSLIVGAIFCSRRWHVAVQVLAALALLACIASLDPDPRSAALDLFVALTALPSTSLVVRLLRDQSVTTMTAARHGEVTDPLTGLNNRRGLERAGRLQWQERARCRQPLAVLAIDVDHFKKINDSLGHAAGDEVLQRLAAVVSGNLRAGDVAVRMGGEEFLILCQLPPEQANMVAERLRRTIERELAPATVSIGVHVCSPAEHENPIEALWAAVEVADRALFSAKSGGRNQVVTSAAA